MSKISVIGAGSVGATIANDLMIQGVASEIVIVDINKNKAYGEALDIYQSVPFVSPVILDSGDYPDTAVSDIVIITCGMPRKPGMTRLDLAQTNVNILKDVTKNVVPYSPKAKYIIVSNPVDILTYVFAKISGIPEKQIIGSGTILDTSRLQSFLAEKCVISAKNVHAYVYGEHGDTSFVPWSNGTIAGVSVDKYAEVSPDKDRIEWKFNPDEVEEFVRKSGAIIIENKGATFYAVAMSVCHICKCIFSDAGTALTLSTMMHGEYGIDDVCLSTLVLVDGDGVRGKVMTKLTDEEIAKLKKSADKLKEVLSQIEF